jgi:hypothetical protein
LVQDRYGEDVPGDVDLEQEAREEAKPDDYGYASPAIVLITLFLVFSVLIFLFSMSEMRKGNAQCSQPKYQSEPKLLLKRHPSPR